MPNAPFLAPERDSALKLGRTKVTGGGAISIGVPGGTSLATQTIAPAINTDEYAPWYTPTPIIIDQLLCEVTTLVGGQNMRFGFYPADTDFQPVGAPLADSGNISVGSASVKTYTPGTPIFVPRGRYVSVFNIDTGSAALRGWRMVSGLLTGLLASDLSNHTNNLTVGRTYAAFPTPGTAWTTVANNSSPGIRHAVFYRVSQP